MNPNKLIIGLAGYTAVAISLSLMNCLDRSYDNPFLADSGISEDWMRDSDGNGVADSVETYARNCKDTHAECLRQAKANAATRPANLVAGQPKLDTVSVVTPPKDSARIIPLPKDSMPVVAPPKDSTPVPIPPKDSTPVIIPPKDSTPIFIPPKDTTPILLPPKDSTPIFVPPKDTTLIVIPPRDTIRDTLVVPPKVTAVTGIEAQVIYLPMGVQKARPSVSILPPDAANQGYTLQSLDEATVQVAGVDLIPLKPGSVLIKARSDDGGFTAQFQAHVLVTDTNSYETAVSAAPMEMVADAAAQAPVITWTPANVTHRGYTLTSSDISKVLVVIDAGIPKCKPIAAGKADLTLKTLGKGLTTVFTVTVKAAPILTIPVLSISSKDLGLVLGGPDLAPEVSNSPFIVTNRGYTLKSDNTNVVSVSGAMLHAVSGGNANITITSLDGPSSVFKVGVTVRATAVSAADQTVVLGSANFSPAVIFTPAATTNKTYSLKSDAPSVIAVVGNQLRAVAGGIATLLITSTDGPVATFRVTVTVRTTSVSAADVNLVLGAADVTPMISFIPAAASNKAYALTSASPAVVSVSNSQLHAVAGGSTIITVTAADGPTTTFRATVSVGLTAISAGDMALIVGSADVSPGVVYIPASATNKTYTLTSSAPTRVSVVANKLHAVAAGTATITLTSADGPTDTFLATVTTPVTLVTAISGGNLNMLVGAVDASPMITFTPTTATNKTYTLSSSDTSVVSVLGGKVHAVSAGMSILTVTSVDGPSSTFTVTVAVPVIAVTELAAGDMTLVLGGANASPVISFTPANATHKAFTLSSDDSTVVSVVGTQLHAVAGGTALITLTSIDGPFSTFTATVRVPVQSISAPDLELNEGDTATIIPVFIPAAPDNVGFTMSSDSNSIVTVNGHEIEAKKKGSAVITLVADDGGATSSFTVTVGKPEKE